MFELRTIPVYLSLCALGLVFWTGFASTAAPMVTFAWLLAGMFALYAGSVVILRIGRSEQSVAQAIDEASQLNRARVAAPRPNPSAEIH
jgi:hypothetical protein